MLTRALPLPVLLGALSIHELAWGAPSADGLYATFHIRRAAASVGEFTCRLEFQKVPRTVASFVGLAEGSHSWLDLIGNRVASRPFFDGLSFHRVVAGFVIQGGSPNGQGTDGPGYTFPDEFDPTLRHSKAGILSMANSGLNSNGSQFFVTLAPTPHLDDLHNVFGEVVEGMNVVTSVQQGDLMERVVITRIGPAATAFDVQAHKVPVTTGAPVTLRAISGGFELEYERAANSESFLLTSDDLAGWRLLAEEGWQGPVATPLRLDITAATTGKPAGFFQLVRVQYPDPVYSPPSPAGRRVTLTDGGGFTLTFSYTNASSGTYLFTQGATTSGPHPVSAYSWSQEAYRSRFVGNISGLQSGGIPITQVNISLVFHSPTNGIYGGSLNNLLGQPLNVRGAFVVGDL